MNDYANHPGYDKDLLAGLLIAALEQNPDAVDDHLQALTDNEHDALADALDLIESRI